jgi:uncharacterized protein with PQ loop repeat
MPEILAREGDFKRYTDAVAGLFHLSKRKRGSRQLEPYPARRTSLRVLDGIVLFTGTVGPLMTIPQIVNVYVFHETVGVSLFTWGMYAIFDIPWIVYGVVHRERPITITYILWFTMNALVEIGVVVFGGGF